MSFESLNAWSFDPHGVWSHGFECYAAITAVLPILGAFVTALIGSVFVAAFLALGVDPDQRWLLASLVFVSTAVASWAARESIVALARHRRLASIVGLDRVARSRHAVRDAGHEAHALASLVTLGPPIAMRWVVTARAFEKFCADNDLDTAMDDAAELAERIRNAPVRRRLARRLASCLAAEVCDSFELTPSCCDEQPHRECATAGVPAKWQRAQPVAALEQAIREVWASAGACRHRAILVKACLPRERLIAAPSVALTEESRTGDALAAELVALHAAAERRAGGSRRIEFAIRSGCVWIEQVSHG